MTFDPKTPDVEDRIRDAYRGIDPSPDLEQRIAALVAEAPQTAHGAVHRPRARLALVAGVAAAAALAVILLRPMPVPEPELAPAAKAGAIRGMCRLSEAREPWIVPVREACAKGQAWGADHRTQRLVLGEGLVLANCLVEVKDAPSGKEWPEAMRPEPRTATITVRDGDYRPHVTWMRARTQLVFENAGACDNNVHGYFESLAETKFNFSLGPKSVKNDVANAFLDKPGIYILKDDIHNWINGYVHVVAHPYFDLTSATMRPEVGAKAGEFVLTDVPPGEYELVCWHESMEERPMIADGKIVGYRYMFDIRLTAAAKVEAGKTSTVDFTIPAPPR